MRIGVDESGTGAWAGPFTVCACILFDNVPGLADSKALTENARIRLTGALLDPTSAWFTIEVVEPQDIRRHGHFPAWENAIVKVAERAIYELTSVRGESRFALVVDGSGSNALKKRLPGARFEPKADSKYAEVSAASIVAKVERNIRMRELHQQYPVYGWDKNFGYGSAQHIDALAIHGPSPYHRKIRGRIP